MPTTKLAALAVLVRLSSGPPTTVVDAEAVSLPVLVWVVLVVMVDVTVIVAGVAGAV